MFIGIIILMSNAIFGAEVDYYYSTQKTISSPTKNNDGIEALYDCTRRVGNRFGDNKYLANSFGINAEKGIVFFQGRENGNLGIYFLREGEIQFTPYSSGASGEVNVFPIPSSDSLKIGILKRERDHLIGTSGSFKNSTEFPRPQYPLMAYPNQPKNVKAGRELYDAITGGLSSALDNYCIMFREKKLEDEKRNNREYNDLLDYGALQTCRFALKNTGHNDLVKKVENIITSKDCLNSRLDPVSKELKDDKLNNSGSGSESMAK